MTTELLLAGTRLLLLATQADYATPKKRGEAKPSQLVRLIRHGLPVITD